MADDTGEERRLDVEAAAAPNRDRRGEPRIIEGETVAESGAGEGATPSAEPSSASQTPSDETTGASTAASASEPSARRRSRFISAGLGGLAGAIVAAAIVWLARPVIDPSFEARLATLEQNARDLTNGVAALNQRLAPLEASAANVSAAADAAKTAKADSQTARADAAKALAAATKAADLAQQTAAAPPNASGTVAVDLGPVKVRLDKLESALAALDRSAADQSAINDRLAKLEAALAAPKNESRAGPEALGPAKVEWVAIAIAAQAVVERLAVGAPYAPEQAALARLGADPAKLAALAPFSEKGAPTGAALAADFEKIAPDMLKSASPKAGGGVIDRLMNNMSKVVKVTPIGATTGDDPAAIAVKIAAALDRGDIAGAAALRARLPEAARQASEAWANAAEARLAAERAARGLLDEAMAALAKGDKP